MPIQGKGYYADNSDEGLALLFEFTSTGDPQDSNLYLAATREDVVFEGKTYRAISLSARLPDGKADDISRVRLVFDFGNTAIATAIEEINQLSMDDPPGLTIRQVKLAKDGTASKAGADIGGFLAEKFVFTQQSVSAEFRNQVNLNTQVGRWFSPGSTPGMFGSYSMEKRDA